jgi:hypothetical protein
MTNEEELASLFAKIPEINRMLDRLSAQLAARVVEVVLANRPEDDERMAQVINDECKLAFARAFAAGMYRGRANT